MGFDGGFGGGNGCWIIFIILILCCCCGNHGTGACGDPGGVGGIGGFGGDNCCFVILAHPDPVLLRWQPRIWGLRKRLNEVQNA